ncbi:MAG: CBS domain-containing protein [Methanomassiliicoccales archaeon]|nr:MAG: CBS domain-containing protein [Methanomassiliicoccales archaeon]
MRVKDLMTQNPVVAKLPGSREDVLRLLVKHKITGLPVTKKDGTYVGFVARKNLFAQPEEEQLALLMKKDWPTISPNSKVEDAVDFMIKKDVHFLPVVEKKKVRGIITPADILIVVEKTQLEIPVEELLRSPCVPIYELTPLVVALRIMGVAKVFALPVLDKKGHLSGIITDRDIFDKSHVDATIAMSDLGLAEEEDSWTWEGLRNIMKLYYEESKIRLPDIFVKDVMVSGPTTVFAKTGVSEASRLMRKNDFGQLPIRGTDDRLFGMIYDLDALIVLLS